MITTEEIFTALGVPEEEADFMAGALRMLAFVQPESLNNAINAIGRAEGLAPFVDPTGLVTGELSYERSRRNKRLL
jgi:hypothetical protein